MVLVKPLRKIFVCDKKPAMNANLTYADQRQIWLKKRLRVVALLQEGMTQAEIAAHLNLSRQRVNQILAKMLPKDGRNGKVERLRT